MHTVINLVHSKAFKRFYVLLWFHISNALLIQSDPELLNTGLSWMHSVIQYRWTRIPMEGRDMKYRYKYELHIGTFVNYFLLIGCIKPIFPGAIYNSSSRLMASPSKIRQSINYRYKNLYGFRPVN